jgi:hypothetical protein
LTRGKWHNKGQQKYETQRKAKKANTRDIKENKRKNTITACQFRAAWMTRSSEPADDGAKDHLKSTDPNLQFI